MKKKIAAFKKLKYDTDRWKWLQKNQDIGIIVYLDNDDTMIVFPDEDEDALHMDCYLGNSEGIGCLLDMLGINYDHV